MNENQPKISFVMPEKNRGQIIGESIQSIIDQTVSDWELIIVDDHSDESDQTEVVVNGYRDSRIRFIRIPENRGGGIPQARNFGNMFAISPIIAVADSDDLYFPDRARLTIEAFEREKCDVFYGRYDVLYRETGQIREAENQKINAEIIKSKNCIPHSTAAYWSKLAYEYPYNSFFRRGSDYDLFTRLFVAGKKFYFCPEKIMTYVVHQSSITQGQKTSEYNDLLYINRGWLEEDRNQVLKDIIDNE